MINVSLLLLVCTWCCISDWYLYVWLCVCACTCSMYVCTPCQENDTDVARYNFSAYRPILV